MLFKCPECGKEISDKAKICPSCGCPIKKKKINKIYNNKKIVVSLFISIAFVIIIISMVALKINEFTPYLKYMGKSYKELPDNYEFYLTETTRINVLNVDEMFGIPCKFEFMSNIANSTNSSENIEIVSWMSCNNKELTDKEISTVKNRLIKLYNDWDKGNISDAEDKVYIWENVKGYSLSFSIAMDKSSMSITWYDDDVYND